MDDNIKMNLKEKEWESVDSIIVAEDRHREQGVVQL